MKTLAELHNFTPDNTPRCEECHDEIDRRDEEARIIEGFLNCGRCARVYDLGQVYDRCMKKERW